MVRAIAQLNARLTRRQRIGFGVLAMLEFSAKLAAARDIQRRRPAQIRGSKRFWRLALAVNTVGATGYFLFGRRHTEPALRYVDPHAPRGRVYRSFAGLASSRFATWLATKAIWSAVVWRIDPWLLRISGGRLCTGLLLPTALLQTRGARTGVVRRNAVIYIHDGEHVAIFASHAGRAGNPSWFYNARANPDVLLGGRPFRAEIVEDELSRARLWELADTVFPAFATYRTNAARVRRDIPILRLTPRLDG